MPSASSIIAGLAFLLLAAPPAEEPEQTPAEPQECERTEATLRFLDFQAKQARRERLVQSSFGLVLASSQIGFGAYGITVDEDGGPGLTRAAIGQTVAGGLGFLASGFGLVYRSPLERMRRGPSYKRLSENPADPQAMRALRSEWQRAAKSARRGRLTRGGLQIGFGSLLIAASSARLAASGQDTSTSEQVWAFTTLTSAIGLTVAAIPTLILPSATERSLSAYEAARSPAKAQVRVTPSLGGLTVSGHF